MTQLRSSDATEGHWLRVDKANPCPVCRKGDWCLVAADGSAAICPRVSEGAERSCGEAGYLHRLRDRAEWHRSLVRRIAIPLSVPSTRNSDLAALAEQFRAAIDPSPLERLAQNLGLSVPSLRRLGIGWCAMSRAWSFPMEDATGRILGIRLRSDAGSKFSIKGGHEGLFIPRGLEASDSLLISEGPTDCATLLDLGFDVVGRPNRSGGSTLLIGLAKRLRPIEVVVVADNDPGGQGLDGAMGLVQKLVIHVPRIKVIIPPPNLKDARAWKRAGATHRDVSEAIQAAEVHRLSIGVQSASSRPGAKEVHRAR